MSVGQSAHLSSNYIGRVATCWECEALSVAAISVQLPVEPIQALAVTLCAACYERCFLPLVSELRAGIEAVASELRLVDTLQQATPN